MDSVRHSIKPSLAWSKFWKWITNGKTWQDLRVRLNWEDCPTLCILIKKAAPPRSCSCRRRVQVQVQRSRSMPGQPGWASHENRRKLVKDGGANENRKPHNKLNTRNQNKTKSKLLDNWNTACYFTTATAVQDSGFRAGETGCHRNNSTEVPEPLFILSHRLVRLQLRSWGR